MLRESIKRINVLMLFLCVYGCGTLQQNSGKSLNQTAINWINQTAAVVVEEVYSGNDQLYIKYRAFLNESQHNKVFYAKADWHQQNETMNDSFNLSIPLEIIDQAQWNQRPEHLTSVRNLTQQDWLDFRTQLVQKIVPEQENNGVVVQGEKENILFYYDQYNHLQVVDIKEKPEDILITADISQEAFAQEMVKSFREYLKGKSIEESLLLFSTVEDYESPFLYIDLSRSKVLNLNIPNDKEKKYQESQLKKGLKSFDYLIVDSHILGFLTRPFSSTYRLFNWTKGTAYDLIRPKYLAILESQTIPPVYEGDPMDLAKWEEKLDKIVGKSLSSGTIDFLIGGEEFFPRLKEVIQNAEKTIRLRTFIFDNDDVAVEIADVLKVKSKEKGMKVQVLLDSMGQIMGEGKLSETLPTDFIPPESMEKYLRKNSRVKVRLRSNPWFKADHTKTTTIDDKICFTGGMNIGREYRYDWHDLMMEVRGPIVAEIIREFNTAWEHAGSWGDLAYLKSVMFREQSVAKEYGYPIRPLYTRVDDPQIFKAQLAAIKEAKKYIYINNSYFSDNAILYELIRARRRGVDVRVVLPVNGNHEIMNASNIVTANIMFKNGIRVFFYPGMSHIKAAVYDGWLCTGSANFDKLSFRDNLEFNLATSDPATVNYLLERLFEKDFKKSMEMTELLKSGLKDRIAEFIAEQL